MMLMHNSIKSHRMLMAKALSVPISGPKSTTVEPSLNPRPFIDGNRLIMLTMGIFIKRSFAGILLPMLKATTPRLMKKNICETNDMRKDFSISDFWY